MAFAELVATVDKAAQDHLGAVTVVYEPYLGSTAEVKGIFDERYELVQPGEAGVEMVGPAVWLRLADLPGDPRKDKAKLVINGVRYSIKERQTDGAGETIVLLLLRDSVQ